jgi:hypothetical protein
MLFQKHYKRLISEVMIILKRQGVIFERIFLPIVKQNIYKNQEAKTSEFRLCWNENERKCHTLPLYAKWELK